MSVGKHQVLNILVLIFALTSVFFLVQEEPVTLTKKVQAFGSGVEQRCLELINDGDPTTTCICSEPMNANDSVAAGWNPSDSNSPTQCTGKQYGIFLDTDAPPQNLSTVPINFQGSPSVDAPQYGLRVTGEPVFNLLGRDFARTNERRMCARWYMRVDADWDGAGPSPAPNQPPLCPTERNKIFDMVFSSNNGGPNFQMEEETFSQTCGGTAPGGNGVYQPFIFSTRMNVPQDGTIQFPGVKFDDCQKDSNGNGGWCRWEVCTSGDLGTNSGTSRVDASIQPIGKLGDPTPSAAVISTPTVSKGYRLNKFHVNIFHGQGFPGSNGGWEMSSYLQASWDTDNGQWIGPSCEIEPTAPGCNGVPAPPPVCGNSIPEAGESCDDGNLINGDGCSDVCQIETGPPDTINPTVSITNPLSTGTYSGQSVLMEAFASDNIGVSGVQFRVDGGIVGKEDLTVPYSRSWNTTNWTDGPHTITATARDGSGNTAVDTVIAMVNNQNPPLQICSNNIVEGSEVCDGTDLGSQTCVTIPGGFTGGTLNCTPNCDLFDISACTTSQGGDTTPPSVSIISPVDGATLSNETFNIEATASDASGIMNVLLSFDNSTFLPITNSPYSAGPINTSFIPDGTYSISAEATDNAGNTNIESISISIQNSSAPVLGLNTTLTISTEASIRNNVVGIVIFNSQRTEALVSVPVIINGSDINLPNVNLPNGLYDLVIKPLGHLSRLFDDLTLNRDTTITILGSFKAGDINDDNVINSLDWSVMNLVWLTSDLTSDLNRDGIVNTIDFAFLSNNWFSVGD